MIAFLAGTAAGVLHVVAGPDHLAAVAPMAADASRTAWRSGMSWGLGHTAGVLVVGALLLAFREVLPLESLSAWSERLVGVALIGVGAWGVWHARGQAAGDSGVGHTHQGASFGMGVLHGLAGSGHLFGILPSLAFTARADAALYLGGFGVGAVAGMTAFAAAIGSLSVSLGRSGRAVRTTILYATSALALAVGSVWLFAS